MQTMKRTMTIMGVVALLGMGLFTQPALSQGMGPDSDARAEIYRTQVLIAVNEAGLSVEQLELIHGLAQETLDARDALQAEHEALQAFLVGWSGTPEEFEAAFEEARQGLTDARDALAEQMTENVETLKGELTAAQYEALEQVGPPGRPGHGPQVGGPGMGPQSGGPGAKQGGRFAERGPGGPDEQVERLGLFFHPDLLMEVVTAKIEALQG